MCVQVDLMQITQTYVAIRQPYRSPLLTGVEPSSAMSFLEISTPKNGEKSDTFGFPDVKHPYWDYSLSRAMNLTRKIATQTGKPVSSLADARAIIEYSKTIPPLTHHCDDHWISKDLALDMFDAAIDGKNLFRDSRFVGGCRPR